MRGRKRQRKTDREKKREKEREKKIARTLKSAGKVIQYLNCDLPRETLNTTVSTATNKQSNGRPRGGERKREEVSE